MDELKLALAEARKTRLATMQACHKNPADPALVEADNAAQTLVNELEFQIRLVDARAQSNPGEPRQRNQA